MPPVKHALLSASSASRWLVCTAAPRFEEGLPESTSEYAEEGRLAHAIGELKVTKKCTPMSTRTYNTRLNKLKKDPLYTPEMDKTTDLYLEHITEQVMAYDTAPTVAVEVQVDFSDYVPEGFGTCDCCIIGGDLLSIVDYKHGKGVPVSAVGNPQMRLYALGALHRYAPVFGDTIKRVRMTIDQPRLDSYTTDEITVDELRSWGESIKPIAQKAFSGLGEFVPGDHCRFCRGKAQCRARANINTALEDFKDCVPAGSIPADALVPQEHSHTGALTGEEIHPLLSDEEIGALLYRGKFLVQWYTDLENYATEALKQGKAIPVRQHDVKDCKLRSPFFCCPERVFDGARCPYLCISVPAEKICYHVKDLLLIIHEKDLFLFQIILLHHPSLLLLIIAQKSLLSFLFP